jgi:hypothetical protein
VSYDPSIKRGNRSRSAAVTRAAGLVHLRVGVELAGEQLVRRGHAFTAAGCSLRVHAAMAFGGLLDGDAVGVGRHQREGVHVDVECRARFIAVMATAMLLLRPRRRAVVGQVTVIEAEDLQRFAVQELFAGVVPRFRAGADQDLSHFACVLVGLLHRFGELVDAGPHRGRAVHLGHVFGEPEVENRIREARQLDAMRAAVTEVVLGEAQLVQRVFVGVGVVPDVLRDGRCDARHQEGDTQIANRYLSQHDFLRELD